MLPHPGAGVHMKDLRSTPPNLSYCRKIKMYCCVNGSASEVRRQPTLPSAYENLSDEQYQLRQETISLRETSFYDHPGSIALPHWATRFSMYVSAQFKFDRTMMRLHVSNCRTSDALGGSKETLQVKFLLSCECVCFRYNRISTRALYM